MKKLFISGDSFTAPDLKSIQYPDFVATTNWPEEFVKNMGGEVDLHNAAYRGHNNEYIVKSFFEYIAKRGKPDMVIIMWSCGGRLMMANETWETSRDDIRRAYIFDPIGFQHVVQLPDPRKNFDLSSEPLRSYTSWYAKNYYPEPYMSYAIDNFFTNVYIIQEYCKANDIPYLFSQAVELFLHLDYGHRAIGTEYFVNHCLEDKIDDEKFMGWPIIRDIGGWHWLDKMRRDDGKWRIGEIDNHPNNEGYKMIADKIWEEWKDLYGE